MNYQRMHFGSTSIEENGYKVLLQTDIFSLRYASVKFATTYTNSDLPFFSGNSQSLSLKGNYYLPITRKISAVFSGSGGIRQFNQPAFIYSGGASFYNKSIIACYHLFGISNEIVHSVQLKAEPFIKLKKKESKYQLIPYVSFEGNYTFNDIHKLNPSVNYFQTSFEFSDLTLAVGIHENNLSIRPNVGLSLDNVGFFNFSLMALFNKQKIPTFQFSVIFAKRNKKHTFIRSIPGGVSF